MSWLERHQPDVYGRVQDGPGGRGRRRGGAIAQAWNHMILPLANERDVRTQIRWGLADFRHRFGREAPGDRRLPETAVNATASWRCWPRKASASRSWPPGRWPPSGRWPGGPAARWPPCRTGPGRPSTGTIRSTPGSPTGTCTRQKKGLGVDLVVYHGGLSHALAFESVTQRGAGRPGVRRRRPPGRTGGHRPRRRDVRSPPQVGRTGAWPTPSRPRPPAGAWRSPT